MGRHSRRKTVFATRNPLPEGSGSLARPSWLPQSNRGREAIRAHRLRGMRHAAQNRQVNKDSDRPK